jgi:hypothetical protein
VKDISANATWVALSDSDLMLVHVVSAKVVVETPAEGATAAVAAAEPEVAKKGKTDKEPEAKDKPKK